MMRAFEARHGGKGTESRAELEARSKAVAKRFEPKAPATASRDSMLVKLELARDMVAQARTAQESKAALDIVVAAQVYAKRQELGAEIELEAHGVRVFAERKLGEVLIESPKAKAGRPPKESVENITDFPKAPTLEDLGISKDLSTRAQKLAMLPVAEVERMAAAVPKRKARTARRAGPVHGNCPTCSCKGG